VIRTARLNVPRLAVIAVAIAAFACGGGSSGDEPATATAATPTLAEIPATATPVPVPSVAPGAAESLITGDAGLFGPGDLVCIQTRMGGSTALIVQSLEESGTLTAEHVRTIMECSPSMDAAARRIGGLTDDEAACLGRRAVDLLQVIPEGGPEAIDALIAECQFELSRPPSLPAYFGLSDPECSTQRVAGIARRANEADLDLLERHVEAAVFCLESGSKSLSNYQEPTPIPGVAACENALLRLRALVFEGEQQPLFLSLAITDARDLCTFDEQREFTLAS
jgi:hypothetical protein